MEGPGQEFCEDWGIGGGARLESRMVKRARVL